MVFGSHGAVLRARAESMTEVKNVKPFEVSAVDDDGKDLEKEGIRILDPKPDDGGSATILSSVVNLANVIMGVGILALPLAFSEAGWILGTITMILTAALGILSLHLLGESARLVGAKTFYAVCEAAIPKFGIVIDVAVVVNSFLVCTSYLIVATDSFERISSSAPEIRDVWTTMSAILTLPLVLLRRQDALKFTSFLAVIVLVFIALLSIIFSTARRDDPVLSPCPNSTSDGACNGAEISPARGDPLAFVRAFLTFVSAFKCQQNLLPIASELARPTTARILIVASASIGLALVLYLVVAFAGYFTFGSFVVGDLLEAYPATSSVINVARFGIAIVVLTSFPLSSFAMRSSMRSLLSLCSCARNTCGAGVDDSYRVGCAPPKVTELFVFEPLPCTVSIGFVTLTLIMAMLVTDLGFMVEIGGAIVGNLIMLIAPGLCYARLTWNETPRRPLTYVAFVIAIFGAIMVPLGITVSFLK